MTSYNFMLGPAHPALEEPILFDFDIQGEQVIKTRLKPGHAHRGIEALGMTRNPEQVIHLAERVCGICSVSHTSTFCRAIEAASDITPPPRADYIRTIISELERIHSHTLWAGLLAHEIGFHSILHLGMKAREQVMDTLEYVTGGRVNYGMNQIGGVRRDITPERKKKLLSCAKYYKETSDKFLDLFTNNKTIKMRTQDIGILSPDDAKKLCAVGPTARGSGISRDVRSDWAYAAYSDIGIKPQTSQDIKKVQGDVLDRTIVRIKEIRQSAEIIEKCIETLPKGDLLAEKKIAVILKKLSDTSGESIARNEAPRGDLQHYIRLDKKPILDSWKVKAPTYNNLETVPVMMKNAQVADIPVIVCSIDPCIACLDRVTITQKNKKKKEIWFKDQLRKKSLLKTKSLEKNKGSRNGF